MSGFASLGAIGPVPRVFGAASPKGKIDAAIAAALQPFVDDSQISGGVGLIAMEGRTHVAAVGWSDLATRRRMREDDLFWIASMTKPMAGVCVLILQDEGKLSIDDPVEKHLPEFKNPWLAVETSNTQRVLRRPQRLITVRDLLTHTAGLSDFPAPRYDSSLGELVTGYAREPLQFEPGSRWSYSNPGINTLGRLVEVLSGVPFAEFLEKRLFMPLGMSDTTFWPTVSQSKRLAKSYKRGEDGTLKEATLYFMNGPLSDRRRTPLPQGGLFSTAQDMGRFYGMMLQRGLWRSRRILSESTVLQATRTQTGALKTGFVDGMSWGLGFQVVKEPQGVTGMLSPGTFGHGGAYGTQSWGDPKSGVSLVLMIQRAGLANADASEMRRAFQTVAADVA